MKKVSRAIGARFFFSLFPNGYLEEAKSCLKALHTKRQVVQEAGIIFWFCSNADYEMMFG